jgi:hypothetical protein
VRAGNTAGLHHGLAAICSDRQRSIDIKQHNRILAADWVWFDIQTAMYMKAPNKRQQTNA